MLLAEVFMTVGFLLMVVGIGLWSIPAACLIGGAVLFITGGLETRTPRASRAQEQSLSDPKN